MTENTNKNFTKEYIIFKISQDSSDYELIEYILEKQIEFKQRDFERYKHYEKFYELISNHKICDENMLYYLRYVVKHRIDIFNQSDETRKKLATIVFDIIDESYFNDTNNFRGFIFNDDDFRQVFKNVIFRKRIPKDLKKNNLQYEFDKVNWDILDFNTKPCSAGGLYFCQRYNIMKYDDYGPVEVDVLIKKTDKRYFIVIEDDKIKAECIFIKFYYLYNKKENV